MTAEILATLLFLSCSLVVAFAAEKTRNVFGIVHVAFFIVFVLGLHLANLMSTNGGRYDLAYYLTAHLAVLFYLCLFTLGLIWLRGRHFLPSTARLFDIAMQVRDGWLFAAFVGWLAVEAYLVMRYGESAFSLFRSLVGIDAVRHFSSWWEAPVESLARSFAVGASCIFVIKAMLKRGFWRKSIHVTAAFSLFMVTYVITHSPIVGPRRFILLLFLVGLVAAAWRDGKTASLYLFSRWRVILIAGIVLVGLTTYYQAIRKNYLQPEIAHMLQSKSPILFAGGLARMMIPTPRSERIGGEQDPYFRGGPLDIIYQVIQRRGDSNRGTRGEIVGNAFMAIIPRVIVGEDKKDINADDILAARMYIAPQGPYIRPDVATSLLAIFLADFGLPGIFIAAMVIVLSLAAISFIAQKRSFAIPPLTLFFFGALLHLAANVEGSLVAVLSILRDALILMIVFVPISVLSDGLLRAKLPKPRIRRHRYGTYGAAGRNE